MHNQKTKEFFSPFKTALYIDNLKKQYIQLVKDYGELVKGYEETDKELDMLVDNYNKLRDMFNELAGYFYNADEIAMGLAKKYNFDWIGEE